MRVNLLSYLSDSRNWFIKEHHLVCDTNSGGVILPTTFFILLIHSIFWISYKKKNLWRSILNPCANGFTSQGSVNPVETWWHGLIHMGFIGLITWLGVTGLWKKGLERLKECLRVILSKNLKSVAFTFWAGLYSFCLIH